MGNTIFFPTVTPDRQHYFLVFKYNLLLVSNKKRGDSGINKRGTIDPTKRKPAVAANQCQL